MDGPWTDFQQSDTNTLPWEDYGGGTAVAEAPTATPPPAVPPDTDTQPSAESFAGGVKSLATARAETPTGPVDYTQHPVQAFMKGVGQVGKGIYGILADIGTGESTMQGGSGENVKAAIAGEKQPYQVRAEMPGVPPALAIAQKTVAGAVEMAPKMAMLTAAQAVGVPAPVAAGALFGFDDEGKFSPKQAAIAGALPFIGKWGGAISEGVAGKLGVTSDVAKGLVNAGGGYASANAFLAAQALPGWSKMTDAQKQDAVAGILANGLIGLADLHGLKKAPGGPGGGKLNLDAASQVFKAAAEKAQAGIEPIEAKIAGKAAEKATIPAGLEEAAKVLPRATAEVAKIQPTTAGPTPTATAPLQHVALTDLLQNGVDVNFAEEMNRKWSDETEKLQSDARDAEQAAKNAPKGTEGDAARKSASQKRKVADAAASKETNVGNWARKLRLEKRQWEKDNESKFGTPEYDANIKEFDDLIKRHEDTADELVYHKTKRIGDKNATQKTTEGDSTGTDGRPVLADQNDPNVPKVGETPPSGGSPAPVRPADAEVLTPAVRHDGKVYPAEPGQKNHGAIKLAQAKNGVDILEGEHGFVNKKGEFLTRAEAAKVFEDQTGKKPAKPGELHSEDLDQAGLLKHLDPAAEHPSLKTIRELPPGRGKEAILAAADLDPTKPEQLDALIAMRDKANAARDAAMKAAKAEPDMTKKMAMMSEVAPLGQRAADLREAVEAATGTGGSADKAKSWKPDYKPPFPKGKEAIPGEKEERQAQGVLSPENQLAQDVETAKKTLASEGKLSVNLIIRRNRMPYARAGAALEHLAKNGLVEREQATGAWVPKKISTPPEDVNEPKPASTVRPPAASGAPEMPHSPLAHVEGQVGAIKLKSKHNGTSNDAYKEAYHRLQKLRPELFSPTGSAPDQVVKSLNEGGFPKVTTDNLFDVLLGNHAEQVAIKSGDSPEGRADKFQKALDANAQKKSAQVVSVGDLNVGSEFSVGGEKFKVISIDPDTGEVTAKDGKKFAAQVIPDGADIPADKGSVKLNEGSTDFVPPEKTTGPKLGQGQNQGDLIDSTQSDTLSLTGEKGTDAERLQAAKDKAARDAAEAKAIQAKQQQNLLPPGPGAQTGAGATIASDTGESNMPPLAKLATAVQHFPEQKGGGFKEKMRQWLDSVGIPAKEQFFSKLNSLRAIPDWIKSKATTLPSVNDLDRRVGQWNGAEWENSQAAREFNTQIKAKFKDRSKLRALSNWINAGGDKELLARQAQLAKDPVTRKTYEDALKFGPEEEKLAAAVRHYHDEMLDRGQREGVLEEGLDNYLHRYYRDTDPVLEKKLAALRYMQFSKDFAGFKKRYYDSDFEAEQAGLKPEKDAAKRILAYDYGFNRALIAREFVRKSFDTEKAVAKDGRPELDIAGSGTRIEGDGKGVTLIKPKTRLDTGEPKDYRGDYVQFDHPAFKKWKFATTDSGGQPVLVQGDILVHPDFAKKYQALFEKSWWGKGPVRRGLMAVSNFTKQTMLQGPFHLFQITTGGIEHRINPFKLMDLNPSDPAQRRMAEAGLFAEQGSPYMTEGVSGGGLLDKIPIAGEYLQNSKDWLFNDYIPRWKMTLALTAEARNMERYKKDIQAGKITPEQVTRMSARQAAAVFGGQNQRAIFRSRSTQDTLRALFLAPDFGEERLRQVIQVTGKYGHEQRAALLAGGLGMMVLAKSIEKALTGSMNLSRPFTVTYNGKEYGMRNPASDIAHFVTDPIGYVRNRLNPIYTRPLLELANGRDQFGRKRTFGQQLTDEVKQVVPLPARGLVEKNQTILESLLNSTGITEHRKTAFGDEMQKINKWKESKGYTQPGEFVYDPDKDPYHSLTSQLSAGSDVSAQKELNGLVAGKSDVQRQKIYAHYKRSLATAPHLTGSKAHESEYVKGLSSSEKKAYDDAIAERKAMWQRFQKVWAKKDAK